MKVLDSTHHNVIQSDTETQHCVHQNCTTALSQHNKKPQLKSHLNSGSEVIALLPNAQHDIVVLFFHWVLSLYCSSTP